MNEFTPVKSIHIPCPFNSTHTLRQSTRLPDPASTRKSGWSTEQTAMRTNSFIHFAMRTLGNVKHLLATFVHIIQSESSWRNSKMEKKKLRAAKTRSRWPFFSIQKLQESLQKQVRSPGLSILCVVLQRNLIQVQQLTQSLWSLRSWPLHCPGVHTSAPGRPNEMQHSESPMKAKTQDFDQTQLAGITTQKSAKCWYHKFTETQAQPCKATDLDASWLGAWWEERVRSVRWPLRVPIKTRPLCNLPVSKTIC